MTPLSLPALARAAERHVAQHGPTNVDDLVTVLTRNASCTDHAEAGIRLAVIGGRLALDRDATLCVIPTTEQAT